MVSTILRVGRAPSLKLRLLAGSYLFLLALVAFAEDATVQSGIGTPVTDTRFTVDSAIAMALSNNPRVVAKRTELGIADGELQQASIYFQRNPELSASVARRDVPGSTEHVRSLTGSLNPLTSPALSPSADVSVSRVDSEQHTDFNLELSQEFEVFGQPKSRKAAATARRDVVSADISVVEWEVQREVRLAFYRLLFADKRVELLKHQRDAGIESRELSRTRFESGDISRTDYRQLEIHTANLLNALSLGEANAGMAKSELKALLGLDVQHELDYAAEIPPTDPLPVLHETWLDEHPQMVYARLVTEQRQHEADLVRRQSKPNVTGSVFWTREEADTDIVGLGITVPFPVFNRGQGSIAAARARIDSAEAGAIANAKALKAHAHNVVQQYQSTIDVATAYSREILPMTEQNMLAMENAYRVGDISLADFRVNQRELLETQRAALDVLEAHYRWRAELESLMGYSLDNESRPATESMP